MTDNEVISKIYIMLENKNRMSVGERCDLQRALKEALFRDIPLEEKESFSFHVGKFEDDIFDIVSKVKERSLTRLAEMQIALDRATESIKGI